MPERIFNFAAGPATLPYSVLEQAAKDIVNFSVLSRVIFKNR